MTTQPASAKRLKRLEERTRTQYLCLAFDIGLLCFGLWHLADRVTNLELKPNPDEWRLRRLEQAVGHLLEPDIYEHPNATQPPVRGAWGWFTANHQPKEAVS